MNNTYILMNIVVNIQQFSLQSVHCLDTRRNIMMEGNFTKILYYDDVLISNGIYLKFPLQKTRASLYTEGRPVRETFPISLKNQEQNSTRCIFYFNPHTQENQSLFQQLSFIEAKLIDFYTKQKNVNKCAVYGLRNQLYSGNIKYYQDCDNAGANMMYILKIAGFWETNDSVGITYKFLQTKSI